MAKTPMKKKESMMDKAKKLYPLAGAAKEANKAMGKANKKKK